MACGKRLRRAILTATRQLPILKGSVTPGSLGNGSLHAFLRNLVVAMAVGWEQVLQTLLGTLPFHCRA
jgi:hypothetical protein